MKIKWHGTVLSFDPPNLTTFRPDQVAYFAQVGLNAIYEKQSKRMISAKLDMGAILEGLALFNPEPPDVLAKFKRKAGKAVSDMSESEKNALRKALQ